MKNSTWKAVGTLGIVVALCILLLGGCGTSDFASVNGTVTLDGAPLSGVSISFEPKGDGTSASGKTDSSGRYTLISTVDSSGAEPGDYIVRIRSPEPAHFGLDDEAEYEFSESYVNVVPEKYSAHSELTATVEAGRNTIDFELQSD